MTKNTRPAPFLIADDRALDFLNSVCAPSGTGIDWIGNGCDLLAWLEQTGLLPVGLTKQFEREFTRKQLDEVAGQARELREWFRGFVSTHAGRALDPSALGELENLNRILARDNLYRQINTSDQNVSVPTTQWCQERRWEKVEDLLLPIAEIMGDLICNADFTHVKNCEGPTCTLWFHDVSKNHKRRWCTMTVCGNRAKAAAHRAKKRATSQE